MKTVTPSWRTVRVATQTRACELLDLSLSSEWIGGAPPRSGRQMNNEMGRHYLFSTSLDRSERATGLTCRKEHSECQELRFASIS